MLVMDDFQISKLDRFRFDFFKENLDFEFRSEFLRFVEHFKYREYWITELRKRTDAYVSVQMRTNAYLQMERTDKPS